MLRIYIICLVLALAVGGCNNANARPSKQVFVAPSDEPIKLKYSRDEIVKQWKQRLQAFLDKGVIPLIDLQSSLRRKQAEDYIEDILPIMDKIGVALIAFDSYQSPRKSKGQRGYRWSYYMHQIVNAYPDRFILTTNSGTNKNWLLEKESFVDQLEDQVYSGNYPIMGELDFRHYMSNRQCRPGRTHRDNDISLKSNNGHRVFALSQKTGVPFVIHLEPEDQPLADLEEMLKLYPKAKVIVAHFGIIRHQEKQKKWGHEMVVHLLKTYPNLFYDIDVGHPGRRYKCNNNVLDTVIWQKGLFGSQKDTLKPEYKAIFEEFSDRFVVGLDYGGDRPPLDIFLRNKVKVRRLIMHDLTEQAKHNIGYRNAWRLLTGKVWEN